MRLVPGSIAGRLLLIASVALCGALVAAGVAIGFVMQRFVTAQIDSRLDSQIAALADAMREGPAAFAGRRAVLSGPPFDRPRSGWVWVIRTPDGVFRSVSLENGDVPEIPPASRRPFAFDAPGRAARLPYPAEGDLADGHPVHWRVMPGLGPDGADVIAAAAPREAILHPLLEALRPMALAFLAIAAALVGAAFLQVRLGLRPLERLRRELAEIRAGRRNAITDGQPAEVRPLVEEVNSLLSENAESLNRARLHVANLAHGLKTPLARLGTGLAARGDEDAARQVEAMDRLIRHHLSRARSAALGGAPRARVDPADRLHDLIAVMRSVHAERSLTIELVRGDGGAAACEAQDFDEIFGNLVDNACKWARAQVRISVMAGSGKTIDIVIEDDGDGIAPAALGDMLQPGRRADETAPGFGFGLPIAKELVELYAGSLLLTASPLGGLSARVALPVAA